MLWVWTLPQLQDQQHKREEGYTTAGVIFQQQPILHPEQEQTGII